MNRRRFVTLGSAAGASSLLASRSLLAHASGNVIVKLATVVPKNSVWLDVLQQMADDWKTLSGGAVTMRLYGGGVAGDDTDVVRKLKLGTLDASLLSVTGLHSMDHVVSAMTIPMMFDSYDEFYGVLDQVRPELDRHYEAQGLVVLNWADAGMVRFLTKDPVKTPDDLRKLKIFTWQDDASGAADLWKSAGFNPVPLPSTEITTALQTGLISALPTSTEPAALMQWNQHAKYLTMINWAVLVGATVITKKTWDRIPADVQTKLRAEADQIGEKLRQATRTAEEGAVKAMQARGLTVIEPDVAEWRKVVEPTWPKLKGSLVPAEMWDKVVAARDAWRAKHAGAAGSSKKAAAK